MNLTRHKKRIHEKLKTEVCHVCGKSYLDKYNLKKHVELAHPDLFVISVAQVMLHCKLPGYTLEKKNPVYDLRIFCDLKFREKSKLQVILPLAD